jgi:outer membrane protein assembly factor BamB
MILGSIPAVSASDPGWPQFRGPTGDGQVPGKTGLPLNWSETNNVIWKTEIPYRGWSTPAIRGEQVWLTTATLDGHDFFVYCLSVPTGTVLLQEKLFHAANPEPLGNSVNGYATPSPVIEEGRVFVHFGSYGTACLDTRTLKTLWRREDMPCRHYRGPSSSPVIHHDLLILTFDGADQQYLIALNKLTGQTVWKTNRSVAWNDENVPGQMARDGDLRKAHSTPLIVSVGGRDILLSSGAKAAYAYDPETGKELWRVRHDCWSAAPMPLYHDGLAFFITGSGKTELIAVRTGGSGDVTASHVEWRYDSMVAKTASPILVNGNIYMVSDDGMLTCVAALTGKQVWRSRISGTYAASPIHADGRLYFCNQQGKTTVVNPGPALDIVATNMLDIGLMASPAVAGSDLFLRTKTHVYRISAGGLRKQ